MARPTQTQIARLAGVGIATVGRVLNGRGGVSPEVVERVIIAARDLDWPGRLPERHRGIVRIEVILVRPETNFYARLAKAFRRIAASLDQAVQVQITFVDENDVSAIAARIADRSVRRSGLAVSCPDHERIRTALRRVHAEGLPIVQLVNRNVAEAEFVGIDNYAAGRLAAMLMLRLGAGAGRVVAMRHGLAHQGHHDRLRGFSDHFAEFPREDLAFHFTAFGQDDRKIGAARVRECLAQWPDLTGIYNAGGGNVGILEVLRGAGRDVFFVGHELTDVSEAALRDGVADVILDQLPEAQARRTTDLLLRRIGLLQEEVANPPIRFTTITAQNL